MDRDLVKRWSQQESGNDRLIGAMTLGVF